MGTRLFEAQKLAADWKSQRRLHQLARLLLLFHRLTEAKAFTIHLKDFAVMSQPIQKSGRHAFALENLAPVAERKVACQQKAAAFVTIGEDLKQQFRAAPTERQVPQFVHDQQIRAIQLRQISIQQIRLLLLFEQIHQSRRREESYRVSLSTCSGRK